MGGKKEETWVSCSPSLSFSSKGTRDTASAAASATYSSRGDLSKNNSAPVSAQGSSASQMFMVFQAGGGRGYFGWLSTKVLKLRCAERGVQNMHRNVQQLLHLGRPIAGGGGTSQATSIPSLIKSIPRRQWLWGGRRGGSK